MLISPNSTPSQAIGCGVSATRPVIIVAVSTTSVARAWERWVTLWAMNPVWIDRPTTINPMSTAAAAATDRKYSVQWVRSSGSNMPAV